MRPNRLIVGISSSGVALFFACTPLIVGQIPETTNWKDRFRNEAPKAWAEFQVRATRLQGSASTKTTKESPKKMLAIESIAEFKQAPGCALMVSRSVFPEGKKSKSSQDWNLSGANSKYRFELRRGNESSPWTLVEVSKDLITEAQPNPILSVTNHVRDAVSAPIAINFNGKDDWPAMLASVDFHLLSVTKVEEAGDVLVRVEFDIRWGASETNLIRVTDRGRVWFDPQHLWVMRKCEYKMQRGPRGVIKSHSASYEYKQSGDEFPLLKKMILQNFDTKGELYSQETTEFSLAFADLPEQNFTLSAFGLPEPVDVVWPKPIRWYLWISLAAISSVVLALAFIRVKRHIQKRESVKA